MMRRTFVLSILLLGLCSVANARWFNSHMGSTAPSPPTGNIFLTTVTLQETTGNNQAANWPLHRSMDFRTGDVPLGTHVEIRVASTNTCNGTLLEYQWDQISTRIENGRGGSWRTAEYTVRMPAVLANQKVSLAFCRVGGSYSATPSQITLNQLCSSHPLSMPLTNVMNQDGSTRDSGTATFNLCDYIATTGREAPIETANGGVRHSWIIRGEPIYAGSGHKDPLIYVRLYVDAYSTSGSPSTIDRISHLFNPVNGWMTVAAGSSGYSATTSCSGVTCPAGFMNDPQAVFYTPTVKDGATTIRDYDGDFSTTVSNPTVPVRTVNVASATSPGIGSNGLMIANPGTVAGIYYGTVVTNTTNPGSMPANCAISDPWIQTNFYTINCSTAAGSRGNGVQAGDNLKFDSYFAQTAQFGTPSGNDTRNAYFTSSKSTGTHLYYTNAAFKYTTSGTPPGGMTNGQILYVTPTLFATNQTTSGDRFQLGTDPHLPDPLIVPTSLGTGAQTLQYLVLHRHFTSWYTANSDGQITFSGSQTVDPYEYTLDQGSFANERRYMMQTGTIPPFNLANCAAWAASKGFDQIKLEDVNATNQYQPNNISLAAGGSGGAEHSYIGIVAEWTARWWCDQVPSHVRPTRIFALDGESFPATNILNEQTGLVPTLNNGAPGINGGGGGSPYAGMGALFPNAGQPIICGGYSVDILDPLNMCAGEAAFVYGRWPTGIYPDHHSAYNTINYQLFGGQHTLDGLRMQANRMYHIQIPFFYGPAAEFANSGMTGGGFTFPPAAGTPSDGKHFYRVYYQSKFSQGPRAGGWAARNIEFAGAMGADGDIIRRYFYDTIQENDNYWIALKAYKDCTSTAPYVAAPGSWSNSGEAAVHRMGNQQFMNTYNILSQYFGWSLYRSPFVIDHFNGAFRTSMLGAAGTSGWPQSTPAVYSGSFFFFQWGPYKVTPYGKCVGASVGDVTQFGTAEQNQLIDTSNGKVAVYQNSYPDNTLIFAAGDKVRNSGIYSASEMEQSRVDSPTGIPNLPAFRLGAPDEMADNVWYCIVNIDNTNHIFQVAPPTGTAPNECSSHGSTITSFSGTFETDYCSSPGTFLSVMPPGFNPATTYHCASNFAFRVQSSVYPANPAYVYWGGSGYAALAVAGVNGASASYAASRAARDVFDLVPGLSEAAFDWDPAMVVP